MEDASTSGCTGELKASKLSDTSRSRTGGGSSKALDNHLAPASDAALATNSSFVSSAVEERIEQSKSHWSTLVDQSSARREAQLRSRRKWCKLIFWSPNKNDEEVAEVSNVKVFKDLQRHPTWGFFFEKPNTFAEFVVGEKFAEGAEAELYHVRVTWSDPMVNEFVQKRGLEYVLKVFKKGAFLQDLQFQVPHGYLNFRAELLKLPWGQVEVPRFSSGVHCGLLLKDGRFTFLMDREDFDLRHVIECNMKSRRSGGKGPFSKEEAECIMYQVALGVDFLHSHNIIHIDLKASNVLGAEHESGYLKFGCVVADFENSVGVIGTGFFRAPEILQACKNRKVTERPKVFSRAADIYSYGMVSYEVLTRKLPFEGHLQNDYDLVLNGKCVVVPDYVEGWTHDLLKKCWQLKPFSRPRIKEIIDLFLVHPIEAKKIKEGMKSYWGQNYRDWSTVTTVLQTM